MNQILSAKQCTERTCAHIELKEPKNVTHSLLTKHIPISVFSLVLHFE